MASAAEAVVTFGIPLAPMRTEAEWEFRGRMLSATLTALYRQTDPRFRVLIAGDRMPKMNITLDDRCELVEVALRKGEDYTTSITDKSLKTRAIAERFAADGGGCLMQLDMDDLVSKRIVAHVAQTQDPNGYLFTQGYLLDAATNRLAPLPGDQAATFDECCGSSAILRLTPEDFHAKPDGSASRYRMLNGAGHHRVGRASAADGRPLHVVPFPAAIWVVNHGSNLSAVAASEGKRSGGWQWVLATVAKRGRPPSPELRDEFSLPAAYPRREVRAAGPNGVQPVLTFGIPLAPMRTTREWLYRSRMLEATLAALYRQTDPRFRILLAGDRFPALPQPIDSRVEFVKQRSVEAHTAGEALYDRGLKAAVLAQRVAAAGGGYFLPLDMDDLVSNRIVAHVAATQAPNGYVFAHGHVLDVRNGLMLPFPEMQGGDSFDLACGSSAIFNLAADDLAPLPGVSPGRFHELVKHGHIGVRSGAEAQGRPFAEVPFPAAVWVVNHGSNMSVQMGQDRPQESEGWRQLLMGLVARGKRPSEAERAEFAIPERYPLPEDQVTAPAVAKPTLTVAITTHRRPAGLRRLLAALRPQLVGAPERDVVVVNDGSHDDAYQAVLSDFHDVIQYRALPKNVGVADARNAAAKLARGDFIVFTDDDCEPPPWWLDWLATRLDRSPDLDVVAGVTDSLWPAGKAGIVARVQAHFHFIPGAQRQDRTILFATANVAIRRSLFEAVGGFGFPGKFHGASEDTELASRLSLAGAAMTIDIEWRVRHDIGEPLWSLRRRYWRYGYANGAMLALNTAPAGNDNLAAQQLGANFRDWSERFREYWQSSAGFSKWRIGRAAGSFLATMIKQAYFNGAAAAVHDAGRSQVSGAAAELLSNR